MTGEAGMSTNLRFVIGGLAIVSAIAYLMYTGIRETSAYYLTIQEFLPRKESLQGNSLRVAGRVRPGSVQYDPKSLRLNFEIGEFVDGATSGPSVPVAFTGIKPDMFGDGRDVIIEGRYQDGAFEAHKVLTSCPSKYEAKPEEEKGGRG